MQHAYRTARVKQHHKNLYLYWFFTLLGWGSRTDRFQFKCDENAHQFQEDRGKQANQGDQPKKAAGPVATATACWNWQFSICPLFELTWPKIVSESPQVVKINTEVNASRKMQKIMSFPSPQVWVVLLAILLLHLNCRSHRILKTFLHPLQNRQKSIQIMPACAFPLWTLCLWVWLALPSALTEVWS